MDTLVDRFKESRSMVEETKAYYDKLTCSIDAIDIAEWSESIQEAETKRLDHPSVMDILGAQRSTSSEQERLEDNNLGNDGKDWCRLALSVEERQIDIQDRVRRLGKEPREDDRQEVERLRQILVAELSQLLTLENKALAAIPRAVVSPGDDLEADLFDNLDDETEGVLHLTDVPRPTTTVTDQPLSSAPTMPPERQPISLPSNSLQSHPLLEVELLFRKQQAERYLTALRETIAEKSFHFSHVMRVAPKKSVRTRARAIIVKLNERISLYSRVYTRCRGALVRLNADSTILDRFQVLRREDVNASTAILDPNLPGASSLRLSWIWQTSGYGKNQSPEQVRECKWFSNT